MVKRLILKTVLICVGVFLILSEGIIYYVLNTYQFETEKKIAVLVANKNIEAGQILDESMLRYKTVKESAMTEYMITDVKNAIGNKLSTLTNSGDYIRNYNLIPKEKWYEDDEKIIILPIDVEMRMANLVKPGSIVDIKVELANSTGAPVLVLSKVSVDDVLDENGASAIKDLGNKKAFAKFILNQAQRDKLYIAKKSGKLLFELYCDKTQKAPDISQ